jgi:hypothetical protein
VVNCFVFLEDFVNDVRQALCDKLLPEGVGVCRKKDQMSNLICSIKGRRQEGLSGDFEDTTQ